MFGTRRGGAWPPFRMVAYPSLLTESIAHSCPRDGHLFGSILEGCKLLQKFKSRPRRENGRSGTTTSASLIITVFSCRQLIVGADGCGGNIDCLGLRTWHARFITVASCLVLVLSFFHMCY